MTEVYYGQSRVVNPKNKITSRAITLNTRSMSPQPHSTRTVKQNERVQARITPYPSMPIYPPAPEGAYPELNSESIIARDANIEQPMPAPIPQDTEKLELKRELDITKILLEAYKSVALSKDIKLFLKSIDEEGRFILSVSSLIKLISFVTNTNEDDVYVTITAKSGGCLVKTLSKYQDIVSITIGDNVNLFLSNFGKEVNIIQNVYNVSLTSTYN